MGLSAADPSSGASALQVSSLWVPGVGTPGKGGQCHLSLFGVTWLCHSGLWVIRQTLLPGLRIHCHQNPWGPHS